MIINNLFEFLMLVKDVAPLIVFSVTYICSLFFFKFVFKVHRNNLLAYLLSLLITVGLYYSFIYVFKLSRRDYILDGIKIFARYFYSLGNLFLVLLVNIFKVSKFYNLNDLPMLFSVSLQMIDYLSRVDVEICLYLAFHQSYKYNKKFINKTRSFIESVRLYFASCVRSHAINCVYNC